MRKPYQLIEHTADIGIKIYGKTARELFINAAVALFDQIADVNKILPKKNIRLSVSAAGYAELLVAWLNELIYRYSTKGMLFGDFEIESLSENNLKAIARGEAIDQRRHALKVEVKAATYHELKVERTRGGWRAQVIFDV